MSLKLTFANMQVFQMPSTLKFRRCNRGARYVFRPDNLAQGLLEIGRASFSLSLPGASIIHTNGSYPVLKNEMTHTAINGNIKKLIKKRGSWPLFKC